MAIRLLRGLGLLRATDPVEKICLQLSFMNVSLSQFWYKKSEMYIHDNRNSYPGSICIEALTPEILYAISQLTDKDILFEEVNVLHQ